MEVSLSSTETGRTTGERTGFLSSRLVSQRSLRCDFHR